MKALSEVFTAITRVSPGTRLMTHIIVGFPSETDADFRETMDMVMRHPFHTISLNPYDDKPQSAASEMEAKVAPDTIAARYQIVRQYMQREGISAFRSQISHYRP